MYSQTHYCPNFLLHPTALIHFDGAALRPVFPLQSGSNSSSPSLSAMAHTPGFHLHYLGSALPIYLPPPTSLSCLFTLIFSIDYRNRIAEAWIICHSSAQNYPWFSNIYSPQPRLLSMAFNISTDNSSEHHLCVH